MASIKRTDLRHVRDLVAVLKTEAGIASRDMGHHASSQRFDNLAMQADQILIRLERMLEDKP